MKLMLVFLDVPPYYLVTRHQHWRAMLTLSSLLLFHPEDEGSKFICNIGTYLPDYAVTSHRTAILMLNTTCVHNVVSSKLVKKMHLPHDPPHENMNNKKVTHIHTYIFIF